MPGPVPTRSDQRRRRNKDQRVDKVPAGRANTRVPQEPPRTGRGATIDAWRAYARHLGIAVPDDATRSAIIALVDSGTRFDARWHPAAKAWYESLADSGQSKFYEPSDWQTARIAAEILTRALAGGRGTVTLFERWQVQATELLTTEGARRRVRMELERPGDGEEEGADVTDLSEWRDRLGVGPSG